MFLVELLKKIQNSFGSEVKILIFINNEHKLYHTNI